MDDAINNNYVANRYNRSDYLWKMQVSCGKRHATEYYSPVKSLRRIVDDYRRRPKKRRMDYEEKICLL